MHHTRRTRPRSKGFQVALGCFLALGAILAWEAASSHAGYSWTSASDSERGQTHKIRIRDGRWQLKVDYRGEIDMAPDESGITRLGPTAFLEIDERKRRERRRLIATPGEGGEPEIAWFVDNQAAPFDAEARAWLQKMLPRIYRTSGLDAAGRVGRILAAEGVAGVLREIDQIDGDSVQRIYFENLIGQAEPGPEELPRILRRMGRSLGSDHELRKLLVKVPAQALIDEETANAFLEAASAIGSDYETRKLLMAFLARPESEVPTLSPASYRQILDVLIDASRTITSDHDHAKVLSELAEKYPAGSPLPTTYARQLRSIGSDYELRKALSVAFRRPFVEGEDLDALLETARSISSDYELSELMLELAGTHEGELPEAFFRTSDNIGSDFDLAKVLNTVASRPELTSKETLALLEASRSIGSDHELAKLLAHLAAIHTIDDDIRPAFERAAGSVSSEHHRKRVMSAAGLS